MTDSKQCPECSGSDLFVHGDVSAKGGYGPDLLPGASGVFTSARMRAVVCKGCGLVRFYAAQATLGKINAERGWQRLL